MRYVVIRVMRYLAFGTGPTQHNTIARNGRCNEIDKVMLLVLRDIAYHASNHCCRAPSGYDTSEHQLELFHYFSPAAAITLFVFIIRIFRITALRNIHQHLEIHYYNPFFVTGALSRRYQYRCPRVLIKIPMKNRAKVLNFVLFTFPSQQLAHAQQHR